MNTITRLFETANFPLRISSSGSPRNLVIRPGFLDAESRRDLTELARDGSAAHRLARRANALVLLDDGMDYAAIAKVLLIDDDTIRTWYALYHEEGIEGLASFGTEGSACRLTGEQQDKLTCWIIETLPRTTRAIGAWIAKECRIEYQGRPELIALLHRLGMEHRKPQTMSHKLDTEQQAAFIKAYDELLNQLDADEAVLFADAVYPTHAVRSMGGAANRSTCDGTWNGCVGCWGPKDRIGEHDDSWAVAAVAAFCSDDAAGAEVLDLVGTVAERREHLVVVLA
jgi:transposase